MKMYRNDKNKKNTRSSEDYFISFAVKCFIFKTFIRAYKLLNDMKKDSFKCSLSIGNEII